MGEFNQSKYINDFVKQNYDRLNIQVPKGKKAVIEVHWKAKGYKSLNAYINDLIDKDMERTGEKCINVHDNKGVIIGDNGTINL